MAVRTVLSCDLERDGWLCFRGILFFSLSVLFILFGLLLLCAHFHFWRMGLHPRKWSAVTVVLATVQSLLIMVYNLSKSPVSLLYTQYYLKHLQNTIIVFALAKHGCETLRKISFVHSVIWPVFLVVLGFDTAIYVVYLGFSFDGSVDLSSCESPHWVVFGAFGLLLGVFSGGVGVFVHRIISRVQCSTVMKSQRRTQLFIILFAFVISQCVAFLYDLILFLSVSSKKSCEEFTSSDCANALIVSTERLVDLALPIVAVFTFECLALTSWRRERLSLPPNENPATPLYPR